MTTPFHKFSKALPYAFTEFGAIQASNVLASPQAVEMGIYVVRAFVRLRERPLPMPAWPSGSMNWNKKLKASRFRTTPSVVIPAQRSSKCLMPSGS
ncbi:MAG: hypothetical protein QM749_00075 [Aquabacterium sp.]